MAEDRAAITTICGRPDVRDALARGDWSVVLRAFFDSGLSQTAIAGRTGLSDRRIGREPVWRPATIRKWHSQRPRHTQSEAEPTR
jgi:hypothetical protein